MSARKVRGYLLLLVAVFGVMLMAGSCIEADTTDTLSWTFEIGLFLWILYVIADLVFCILDTKAMNHPILDKAAKCVQCVLKLALYSVAVIAGIRALMLPVPTDEETLALVIAERNTLIRTTLLWVVPIVLLQLVTAFLPSLVRKLSKKQ